MRMRRKLLIDLMMQDALRRIPTEGVLHTLWQENDVKRGLPFSFTDRAISAAFSYRLGLPRAIYFPFGSERTLPPFTASFPRR